MRSQQLALLALVLLGPSTAWAQVPSGGPAPLAAFLSEDDKREVLLRLNELRLARLEIEMMRKFSERDEAQDKVDQELNQKRIENEAKAMSLLEQERDLWKDRANHFETAYNAVTKGSGWGCTVKKVLTLGIARCR